MKVHLHTCAHQCCPVPIDHTLNPRFIIYFFLHHYTEIIVVCPSVRPSVTGGQQKRFGPEKQETVSLATERQKLELGNLCECQPWY